MTNKPYIACALEAALAAKNHGFKYGIKHNGKIIYDCMSEWNPPTDEWKPMDDVDDILEYDGICYIHPESLLLLEPMVGDIVIAYDIPHTKYLISADYENAIINSVHAYEKDHILQIQREKMDIVMMMPNWRIIQRNGLPFPKIQYEESI